MFEIGVVMIVRKIAGPTHHVENISIFFVDAVRTRRGAADPRVGVPEAEVMSHFVRGGSKWKTALHPGAAVAHVTLAGPWKTNVRKDNDIKIEIHRLEA